MREYWDKPAATAEAFRGGWFHSGDLVRQDEDGYIYVVDRKKDMIISGGENIYCAEVENVLAASAKVAEVAVIGVPDPKWGETPLAVIVPHDPADPPTDDEIAAHCHLHLARYKHPRRVVIADTLPRNASGKVLKTRLRQGPRRTRVVRGGSHRASPPGGDHRGGLRAHRRGLPRVEALVDVADRPALDLCAS